MKEAAKKGQLDELMDSMKGRINMANAGDDKVAQDPISTKNIHNDEDGDGDRLTKPIINGYSRTVYGGKFTS